MAFLSRKGITEVGETKLYMVAYRSNCKYVYFIFTGLGK